MKVKILGCESRCVWYSYLNGFKFDVHEISPTTYQLDGESQLCISKSDACIIEEDEENMRLTKKTSKKQRFYVSTREGTGRAWGVSDRTYKQGEQLVCTALSRREARMISNALNYAENRFNDISLEEALEMGLKC